MEFKLRAIKPQDASEINRIRSMRGVMENMMSMPYDRDEVIQPLGKNSHMIVAVTDNGDGERIIGSIGLSVCEGRVRHVGGIGIMVDAEYQSNGVGSALLSAALDIADNWLMLVRVELETTTENKKGIALYKKFGFEIEGTRRMGVIQNGKYVDTYYMGRIRPALDKEP